jgi:flavin-dependent dehydrogenase
VSAPKSVTIAGGGLAGLSLALALRRAGVPVVVHEAGDYPRHRVCGEFIAGLDATTRRSLGLDPFLADALPHREVAWFLQDRDVQRQQLPEPALALGRDVLDTRLAQAVRAAGGEVRERSRLHVHRPAEGCVACHGRGHGRSPWLGLKVHVRNLPLAAGLELHLGHRAYTGLCRLPDGTVNVSGLFLQRPGLPVRRETALLVHLEAAGLAGLAARLRAADPDPESHCAVAGLSFAPPRPPAGLLALGDARAMIPPFTGNGMAMAFQSAALAAGPLTAWARGDLAWPAALARIDRSLRARFRLRLASARALHPLLLRPSPQRWLAFAGRAGLLPFGPLYRALH